MTLTGAPHTAFLTPPPIALRLRDLGDPVRQPVKVRVDEDAPLNVVLASGLPVAPPSSRPTAHDFARALRDRFRFAFATPRAVAQPFYMPGRADSGSEANCLAQAVYYEARGEDPSGQAAVAQVVLNRVRHPAFPKTVCGVVYQRSVLGCQFSFACNGSMRGGLEQGAWRRAQGVAERALNGAVMADVGQATQFHAAKAGGGWANGLLKVAQIGAHVFYQLSGRAAAHSLFRSPTPFVGTPGATTAPVAVASIAPAPETPKLFASPQLLQVPSPDLSNEAPRPAAEAEPTPTPKAVASGPVAQVVDQTGQKPVLTASAGL